MAKAIDIVLEVAKAEGIELAEKAIMDLFEVVEKSAPRLALEAEEPWAKAVGGVLSMGAPAFKSAVEKLADLNHDGKIG